MDYYKRQRKAILDQTSQMIQYKRKLTDEAKETALNVFTTWELSFQQLQTKSTESNSEDLMTLFAFFDCKDISDQLFGTYREAKGIKIESSGAGQSLSSFLDIKKCWDQEKFITVLIVLTQMSLVQAWSRDEQGFCHLTLHPLVKDWIRLRTIITAFCDYARKAANILLATLQTSYHDSQFQFSFADRQRMLSHLDTYNENLEFMETESQPEIFRYFYRDFFLFDEWASDFLSQSGLHAEAEVMCRREVAWCESEFGKEDVRTLSSLHSLACIFENHGKSEEAEEIFRHVILGQEKTLGAEHRDTLRSLYNRATSLRVLGRPGEAEELYRRVHQAREKVLGPDHAETLQSLNGLGKSLAKQGRYKEAEKIQRRLVQVREIQAPQYTSTFYSQWTLGFTLRQQGSYEEAAEYYSRAASSFEKVFGANHPDAIRCRKDYLALLEAMGRSDSSRL
jgi:tetratricopeptide (TPR) repeat protein